MMRDDLDCHVRCSSVCLTPNPRNERSYAPAFMPRRNSSPSNHGRSRPRLSDPELVKSDHLLGEGLKVIASVTRRLRIQKVSERRARSSEITLVATRRMRE